MATTNKGTKKGTNTVNKAPKNTTKQKVATVEPPKAIEANPIKKTMSDKTRYIIVGVVACVLLAAIVAVALLGDIDKRKADGSSSTYGSNVNHEVGIKKADRNLSTETLKGFYETIDSKDTSVVYFASSTCGYCAMEKPIFQNIVKDYGMKTFEIDASKLTQAELNEIITALGIKGSTPATVVVKNNTIVDRQNGYLDGKAYVAFLSKNGAIPEDAVYKQEERLIDINYDEFKSLAERKEANLVLFDNVACSSCAEVRSLLNDLSKEHNFVVNYLSASYLEDDDIEPFINTDLKELGYDEEAFVKQEAIKYPVLFVLQDNEIVDYLLEDMEDENNTIEESDYTKLLKKYGFIK